MPNWPGQMLGQFHPDVPDEAEAVCPRNKARRRDMVSHGKEASAAPRQRGAAGKASGIDGTVRVKLL
ncbi:hypothetical protein D3871_07835 [Noviherbaspirillum saxi]|uniref:Uncharacterized protein n=1 Tax=Noviherbaspirillum saxi TaxID=2320863 RepID=A0A3A3G8E6_9BURK|nr:hypothetical protein D3871_07835 [Noviherbaspirillum saxi]